MTQDENSVVHNEPANDRLWTVDDVSKYLCLKPSTVRSMARKQLLPAIRIGRVWRFYSEQIKRLDFTKPK